MGIAPTYIGFADQCLTAWLPGRIGESGRADRCVTTPLHGLFLSYHIFFIKFKFYLFFVKALQFFERRPLTCLFQSGFLAPAASLIFY